MRKTKRQRTGAAPLLGKPGNGMGKPCEPRMDCTMIYCPALEAEIFPARCARLCEGCRDETSLA